MGGLFSKSKEIKNTSRVRVPPPVAALDRVIGRIPPLVPRPPNAPLPLIQEKFEVLSSEIQITQNIKHMIKSNVAFVGTIFLPDGLQGMGCLLNNGTILTCLHVILDYQYLLESQQLRILDFKVSNFIIVFVKNGIRYQYQIQNIDHSGWKHFVNKSLVSISHYDYAVLTVIGNPLEDLGPHVGFQLDPVQHFSAAGGREPNYTMAISGPYISTQDGRRICTRYCSIAQNNSAQFGAYHLNQDGYHPGFPGLSGQAILPLGGSYRVPNTILYSIHSCLDNTTNSRIGVKISEYIQAKQQPPIPSFAAMAVSGSRLSPADLFLAEFESQIRIQWEIIRAAEINHTTNKVIPGQEIDIPGAVSLLKKGKDIIAHSKELACSIAKTAWVTVTRDDKHQPNGLPHYHPEDPKFTRAHAFYDKSLA
jgi:hypothetical protein